MRTEYPIIGVTVFLVLSILALIAVSPDAVVVPKVSEPESVPSLLVPAPGFEEIPEMIVQEELATEEQEFVLVLEEQVSVSIEEQEPSDQVSEQRMFPETAEVTIPEGTGIPGCEETNECFIPNEVSILVGGLVTWNNVDTAAHTVTSGNPSDGADGVFDSSIFMSGVTFSHTFDEAGKYEYFCMVHPWMSGIVQVS